MSFADPLTPADLDELDKLFFSESPPRHAEFFKAIAQEWVMVSSELRALRAIKTRFAFSEVNAANEDQLQIAEECNTVRDMLLEKNKAYGNSVLDPLRIFSKADGVSQIEIRIDDKLSRLKRGSQAGEDVIFDLIGYLILLRIARRK